METKEFKCIHCGDCCRSQTSAVSEKDHAGMFTNIICFLLNKQYLTLYGWEVEGFQKELEKIGSNMKIIPSTVAYDKKNDETIVLFYTLEKDGCPFWKDNKCRIYEHRPHVCRQYPCIQNLSCFIWSDEFRLQDPKCKAEYRDKFLDKINSFLQQDSMNLKELYRALKKRYDLSVYYCLAYEIYVYNFFTFLKQLENDNKVELAKQGAEEEELLKKISKCKFVDFSEYYKKHTNEDILNSLNIEDIKLKFDTKFMQ